MQVSINEGGKVPIYTFQVNDLTHDWGKSIALIVLNSLRETPKIHYMILHMILFPKLTMEVVPQGPYTIMTS